MPPEAPTTRPIVPTSRGDAEWFAQSAEYYADNDAAQSGTIGSGQETWMQTTVVGPGRIQFRFKMSWVSGDGLAFYVDQGVVASWGQSDTWDPTGWFDIPSGTHTLKWKYYKYSGSTAGSAWIDAIQWTGGVPASGGGADWQQITYTYDPSGRRIRKDVDGVMTRYLYDGDHCIAEYDGDDTLLRKFIHGPSIDEPRSASLRAGSFCMLESPPLGGIEAAGSYAGTYYYHFDALGSVVALSDADGETVQVYEYDVYGQPAAADPGHPNRFMFTGREFDPETGLYYYRARYYNASIGRFLQTDPIGYEDGMNWYAYCRNNPIGSRDPSGCHGEDVYYQYSFSFPVDVIMPTLGLDLAFLDPRKIVTDYFNDFGVFVYGDGVGWYVHEAEWSEDRASFNVTLEYCGQYIESPLPAPKVPSIVLRWAEVDYKSGPSKGQMLDRVPFLLVDGVALMNDRTIERIIKPAILQIQGWRRWVRFTPLLFKRMAADWDSGWFRSQGGGMRILYTDRQVYYGSEINYAVGGYAFRHYGFNWDDTLKWFYFWKAEVHGHEYDDPLLHGSYFWLARGYINYDLWYGWWKDW